MLLNNTYQVLVRSDVIFLVNTENGDVFEINDVTSSILNHCSSASNAEELSNIVYSIYENTSGDYSKADLLDFIEHLIDLEILIYPPY